jgi:hypothetical protein
MTSVRTDIHRPSAIQPEQYSFIGVWYDPEMAGFPGAGELLQRERQIVLNHMSETGGAWAKHEHGGSCFCCGARAAYLAVYYHEQSREYLQMGETCSVKMEGGHAEAFATARRSVKAAREAMAGKRKAQALLSDMGMSQAWELFELEECPDYYEERTIRNMVQSLVRYGRLSEKQEAFMRNLLNGIAKRGELAAKRAEEKADAAPCPTGRLQVTGTVLTTKWSDGTYGSVLKMLVKTTEGYTLWGTVPSAFEVPERGTVVTFKATIEPAKNDPKHGFFSRPIAQKQ